MMYLSKTAALTIGVTALAVSLIGGIQPAMAGPASTGPPAVAAVQPAIPDAALLQPEDLGGAPTTEVTDDYWDSLRPPQPCADRPYGSAALRRADRAVSAMIGFEDRPTVIVNDVAVYRADGAQLYLRELRRHVASCDGWTVVAGRTDSVLLRHREYIDYAEVYKNTYVMVARAGRVLVTVADTGWETGSGHEALVRDLGKVAVQRAAVANRK
jgi:hypothetical protein